MAKLSFEIKQKVIEISGTCFWLWDNFYAFLENCGIDRDNYKRHEGDTKYKIMRNVLLDLENRNDEDKLRKIVTELYRLKSIPDNNVPDIPRAKKVLQELKNLCGEDLIEKEIQDKKIKENTDKYRTKSESLKAFKEKLQFINSNFLMLFKEIDPNKRGFELEKIVYDLFLLNEFETHKSYKSNNEQIDGYFKYDKFDYLLEVKWIKETIKQNDLAIFDKKIDKKARSTRGFFIAMNGFDPESVISISGNQPRIILMDGEDLSLVFNDSISLIDAIKVKVDNLVKHGNTYYQIKNKVFLG